MLTEYDHNKEMMDCCSWKKVGKKELDDE